MKNVKKNEKKCETYHSNLDSANNACYNITCVTGALKGFRNQACRGAVKVRKYME